MRELLKTINYKAGYQVRHELLTGEDAAGGPDFVMKSAFTPDGHYIGNPKWAYRLIRSRGLSQVQPAHIDPEANGGYGCTCSIGFQESEQKWYGWSHRALYGFGVGDVVAEDDLTASSGWTDEWLTEHPEDDTALPVGFKAHSLDDAKRMAVAFAEAVS